MCKRSRIVLLLGAGFPLPWGTPTSAELKDIVIGICKKNEMPSPFIKAISDYSFKEVVEALYLLYHSAKDKVINSVVDIKNSDDKRKKPAGYVYGECINEVLERVSSYENKINDIEFNQINQGLIALNKHLKTYYKHINVYSTNYDEILPKILHWEDSSMSRDSESFIYEPLSFHHKRQSYSNLHGSIHLQIRKCRDDEQYVICYTPVREKLMTTSTIYGGNPGSKDLFSPIIAGLHKTQMVLSKHFNYPFVCFANDLSDADMVLVIGYSFSDLHLNALIQQYSILKKARAVIVDLAKGESLCKAKPDDYFFNVEQTFHWKGKYCSDNSSEKALVCGQKDLVFYKNGVKEFLFDKEFWKEYLV